MRFLCRILQCGVVVQLLLVAAPEGRAAEAGDPAEIASVLAEGFRSNKEAIRVFAADVRERVGGATALSEVLRDGPSLNVKESSARWAQDEQSLAYRRKGEERLSYSETEGTAYAALPSVGILTDGERTLDFNLLADAGTLRTSFAGIAGTTWNGAGAIRSGTAGEFSELVDSWLQANETAVEILPLELLGNQEVTPVRFKLDGSTITFFVDEGRGFLPLETRCEWEGGSITRQYITDIASVSGDRWFPLRVVAITLVGPEEGGTHMAKTIEVSHLKVDGPISKDEFSLELSEGTRFSIEGEPRTATHLTQPERIHVSNMRDLFRRAAERKLQRNESRSAESLGFADICMFVAGIGAMCVLAALAVRRWRR